MRKLFQVIRGQNVLSQQGMSLIGVITAAGIGLIVVMGMTDLMTNIFKSQRAVQSKDSGREIFQGIRMLLADPQACANSFATMGPLSASGVIVATQIKDKNGNLVYAINTNYINNLVRITGFEIRNFDQAKGMAELNIKMDKVGATVGGTQMLNKMYLNVTTDASSRIVKCHALGSADSLWQLSSNLTDIYFSGGNVGIGMTNPPSLLTVNGLIETQGVGGIKFPDGTIQTTKSIPMPPVCMGTSSLHWSGTSWSCDAQVVAPAPTGGGGGGAQIITGSSPNCPAGTSPAQRNWLPNTCGSPGISFCGAALGKKKGCTTSAGWSSAMSPPTCSYVSGCQTGTAGTSNPTNATCTASSWTQVQCL